MSQSFEEKFSGFQLIFGCLLSCFFIVGCATSSEEVVAKKRLDIMGVESTPDRIIQFSAQGDVNNVELLLQSGLDVNTSEPRRNVSALHNAAAQGHLRLVSRFLELNANVNAQDWHGNTALISAAYFGRLEVVKILVAKGAEINIVSREGLTALTAAIYSNNQGLVSYLLDNGADPRLGRDPALVIAERSNRKAMAELVRQRLAKNN